MNKIYLQSEIDSDENGDFMYLKHVGREIYERVDKHNPPGDATEYHYEEFFSGKWGEDINKFRLELIYD